MPKIACSLLLSCTLLAASQPGTQRRTLTQPTTFNGFPCASGYAWFFTSGRLAACTLAQDIPFGEASAPSGSWIRLNSAAQPAFLAATHDLQIDGYTCRGAGAAGSEGYTTAFYPTGKLKACWLTADQPVQGVPCAASAFLSDTLHGIALTAFYPSGKLRSCKLTQDFGKLRRGQILQQQP